MTKRELAAIRAYQMKQTNKDVDIERTIKVLVKGMTANELQKAINCNK